MPDHASAPEKPDEKPAESTPPTKTAEPKAARPKMRRKRRSARKVAKLTAKKTSRTRQAKKSGPKIAAFDVRSLREKLGLSRIKFAKKLGAVPESVRLWENGREPSDVFVGKLEKLAKGAGKGRVPKTAKPEKRKPGRPPAPIDVAALRSRLGLSRVKFAKLAGASAGSIENWEKGATVPSPRFVEKLRALAGKGKSAPPAVPAARAARARRGGRPGRRVAIVGEVPVVYADAVSVVREGETARVRFGMRVPGERGARCVADVVVSGEAVNALRDAH